MKNFLKIFFGIIVSAFFLYLSMKDVNFKELINSFKQANYFYLIFIAISVVLTLVIRTFRWQIMLLTLKKISFKNLFPIFNISLMLTLLLPARLGEFARAIFIGEKEKISKTSAFSTVVLERILDGCVTIFFFVCALLIAPETKQIEFARIPINSGIKKILFSLFANITEINGQTTAVFSLINLINLVVFFYLFALAFVIILKLFKNRAVNVINKFIFFLPPKIKTAICNMLSSFVEGLNCLSNFKSAILIIFYSFLFWFIIGIYNYLFLLSLGIECKFYISFIILGFCVIGVMIPAAPGFIGTYHYAVKIAFDNFLPGYIAKYAAFAWISWAYSFFITIAFGFYYLKKENIKIKELKTKNINS